MDKYNIRYITTEGDFEKLFELRHSRSSMMRTRVEEPDLGRFGEIVGAFDNHNNLVCSLRVTPWPDMLSYSLGGLYIKRGIMKRYDFSDEKNPVIPVVDFILEEMENRKHYMWFYSRALSPGYHKIQDDGNDLLTRSVLGGRYERFVVDIVEAGTRSPVTTHDKMLNQRTWDKNIMIVMCSLRNEYRCWGDVFKNEDKFYAHKN